MEPFHVPIPNHVYSLQLILHLTIIELVDLKKAVLARRPLAAELENLRLEGVSQSYFLFGLGRHWGPEKGSVFPRITQQRIDLAKITAQVFAFLIQESFWSVFWTILADQNYGPVLSSVIWLGSAILIALNKTYTV